MTKICMLSVISIFCMISVCESTCPTLDSSNIQDQVDAYITDKIRVPSTFLKKNQSTLVKKKLKVRIPSKFLKKRAVVKKVNDTNTMVKKKLKVRIPSKFLKKVVKKKVKVSSKVFKKNLVKLRKKKKVAKESECPTTQKKNSSTLSAVKRLVRLKRKAKVHPITSTK